MVTKYKVLIKLLIKWLKLAKGELFKLKVFALS